MELIHSRNTRIGREAVLYKTIDHPASGFTLYCLTGLALLLFALPFYLVINIWMICYGPQAYDIVGRHLLLVVGLGIVPSWIIGHLVYWKKDRYLNYFAFFEKESKKTEGTEKVAFP